MRNLYSEFSKIIHRDCGECSDEQQVIIGAVSKQAFTAPPARIVAVERSHALQGENIDLVICTPGAAVDVYVGLGNRGSCSQFLRDSFR